MKQNPKACNKHHKFDRHSWRLIKIYDYPDLTPKSGSGARSGPKTFVIKMPKFRVNNLEVELPLIKLTYKSEKIWYSLP